MLIGACTTGKGGWRPQSARRRVGRWRPRGSSHQRPSFSTTGSSAARRCWRGLDFPIGVPAAFGKKTGLGNFPEALAEFGKGKWREFFCVADRLEDISLSWPFYPETYPRGRRQAHLINALGVELMDDLRRECERKTPGGRRAACSVFWTLGGNQVGKAAIDGWKSVIQPGLRRGARLWPFFGRLDELSKMPGCVLCETYPQEAYRHVEVSLPRGRGRGKRNQEDRRNAGAPLLPWMEKRGISFDDDTREKVLDGFRAAEIRRGPV